jgi:hypothetical protein
MARVNFLRSLTDRPCRVANIELTPTSSTVEDEDDGETPAPTQT